MRFAALVSCFSFPERAPMKTHQVFSAFVICVSALMSVHAAPSAWPTQRYQYTAEGKPLRDVLRDFASSQGMAISMSSDIDGVVSGKFDFAPARFIELMAKSYGFSWYFDGVVLHIASAQDMQTRVIRLSSATTIQFREMINRIGLAESRFPVQYDDATNTAIVQGPSPYVALVLEMGSRLEARSFRRGAAETRIFQLKNATAGDLKGQGEGDQATIKKGVATILRELYAANGTENSASALASASLQREIIRRGIGEPSTPLSGLVPSSQKGPDSGTPAWFKGKDEGTGAGPMNAKVSVSSSSESPDEKTPPAPVILANETTNSVVIRDLPERMAGHEALIKQLDSSAERIEIEVQIIEVNNEALDELGVDWRLRSRRVGIQSGNATAVAPDFAGFSMTALMGGARNQLLARVNALTEQGRARVVSKPRVATLNHQSAYMSSQQKIHVKVEAFQSAQLYPITAGTDLRVLPSASLQNGQWRIHMDVNVQDGRMLEARIGDIPIITSNRIDTQAVVADGESLLLAGYAVEEESRGKNGVPGLSAIPVIGRIFSNERVEKKSVVRLFMVSPRMLP